jgi:hypothetical protein
LEKLVRWCIRWLDFVSKGDGWSSVGSCNTANLGSMDNRFEHNFESSCDNWQLVERSMRSVDPVIVGTVVIRIVGCVGIIRSAGAGLDTVIPHDLCVWWNITQGVEYYCWMVKNTVCVVSYSTDRRSNFVRMVWRKTRYWYSGGGVSWKRFHRGL